MYGYPRARGGLAGQRRRAPANSLTCGYTPSGLLGAAISPAAKGLPPDVTEDSCPAPPRSSRMPANRTDRRCGRLAGILDDLGGAGQLSSVTSGGNPLAAGLIAAPSKPEGVYPHVREFAGARRR